ncbi:MAG: type II secretory protein, partial [Ignisphaera sp.]
ENIESLIRRLVSPPMSVSKSLISTAKLFIHVLRLVDVKGVRRKVTYVYEVESYNPLEDRITVKTLVKWDRYRDAWLIDTDGSSVLKEISDLILLSYDDVIEDLYRRTALLLYATRNNLDIVSLYALARRYRREPETTYREVVRKMDGEVVIEKLRDIERRTL